jgi:hypothetical protein
LVYPNPESVGAWFYGKNWFPWEVPRHLIVPPSTAVSKAALQFGLKTQKVYTSTTYALEWLSYSSDFKSGRPITQFKPNVKNVDRCLCFLEGLLVLLRRRVGEELTIVLVKQE